jgi:hypothetical protein
MQQRLQQIRSLQMQRKVKTAMNYLNQKMFVYSKEQLTAAK